MIVEELINILSTQEIPVFRQGSLDPEQAFPASFFTFWENAETEISSYDNQALIIEYDFDVNIYSTDPTFVYTALETAGENLKAAGWIITDRGHDMPSGVITHTGRGLRATFLKNQEMEE